MSRTLMSRTLIVLSLSLAACAQSVVANEDRGPGAPRDGSTAVDREDAAEARQDAAGDGGSSVEPGRDAAVADDAQAGADALPADVGGSSGPCMRRLQEDIQVPAPVGMAAFQNVRGMVFDSARRLYVLSRSSSPFVGWVTVLGPAPEHALIRTFGRDHLRAVHDLVVDASGNVLVLDWNPDGQDPPVVHVYDPQGNFVRTWPADCAGNCDEAWSITRDDTGRIYTGGLVLFRFDAQGTYVDAIGRWGDLSGRMGLGRGLAFDPRGFVWVADLTRNRIHQYDIATGSHVIEIGGRGVGPGLFDADAASDWRWGPSKLALDANGAIYANDPYASRIQKLSRQGTFLGEFSFGTSMEIGPIQVEPSTGSVYVGRGTGVAIVCAL